MSTTSTFAEVAEGVRAALAAYTQALDDGRTDDVVAHLLPRRRGARSRAWAPTRATTRCAPPTRSGRRGKPQRHLVLNTLVTDWNDHEATAISDVVFILKGDDGWAIQLVGRYHDTLHHADGAWRFHHRAAAFET